jgi:hypothetical protein
MSELPFLEPLYKLVSVLMPFDCMQMGFMQRALLALLLLAPMTASTGIQVVNFRMAFFADAISHSAFAGVAIGILLALNPHYTMPLLPWQWAWGSWRPSDGARSRPIRSSASSSPAWWLSAWR